MAYKYEKVNQQLLVPQIEDQLLMYIQEKNIAIGSKLPSEYKLAELFGVGRSTIREAVKSLVTKGILEVKRGSGTFVTSTKRVADDPFGFAQLEDKYRLAMELFEMTASQSGYSQSASLLAGSQGILPQAGPSL